MLFGNVAKVVKRPEGFTRKLLQVVTGDPQFVVTGSGNEMTLSAAETKQTASQN